MSPEQSIFSDANSLAEMDSAYVSDLMETFTECYNRAY